MQINHKDITNARMNLESILGLANAAYNDAKQNEDLAKQARLSRVRGSLYSALYHINKIDLEDLT